MPGIFWKELLLTAVGVVVVVVVVVVRRIEAGCSHVDGVGVVENGFVENAIALFVDGTEGRGQCF